MPFDVKKNRREEARKLRKRGWSYRQISRELALPVSTIASWVKRLKLTEDQYANLMLRRREQAKKNITHRSVTLRSYIVKIQKASVRKIGALSRRELWLMGLMLLWGSGTLHGGDQDLRGGVSFSSSDPALIKFFLQWLKEVGELEEGELLFHIFLRVKKQKDKDQIDKDKTAARIYWSETIKLPIEKMSSIYIYRAKNNSRAKNYGFLRVHVRGSSMLARQIAGWIEGIIKNTKV